MYEGSNNERDRMQENLAKAFSLLDDDKPKATGYGGSSSGGYQYGGNRIGTAPAGGGNYPLGGAQRSNFTGSEFGDSEIGDSTSQMRGRAGQYGGGSNQYGVPELGLGLQPSGTFGGGISSGGMNNMDIGTIQVGGSRRSGQRFIGGGESGRSASDNRSNVGMANSGNQRQFGNEPIYS